MQTTQRVQTSRPLPALGRCAPRRLQFARPQHVAAQQRRAVLAHGAATDDTLTADVVIVGAGIVGLFAAADLLKAGLSVALLERQGLCAGATGAGQGYLWMAHRNPGSVGWALAARSVALWQRLVGADPAFRAAVEWQDCGSLLVATSPAEAAALSERQMHLNEVGVRASYMDGRRLADAEPGLALPHGGAALLVQADTQINGRKAAHVLLEQCRAAPGFTDVMGEGGEVQGLELAAGPGGGHVVQTKGGRVRARHALVLAAGVWTGGLLAAATHDPEWKALLQPRRGHLLELPQPAGMPRVVHGMMEMSYTKHYAHASGSTVPAPGSAPGSAEVDITFTATTSASGSLLVGSSREFSGWEATPSPAVVSAIMQRAAMFLPGLQPAAAQAAAAAAAAGAGSSSSSSSSGDSGVPGMSVRVGLRPYAVGGLPMVGPVAGAPGLFVAAGHEGSGLCMGPATGQLLSRHVRKHMGATATATATASSPSTSAAAAPAAPATVAAAGTKADSLDTASFQDLLPDVRRKAALAKAGKK